MDICPHFHAPTCKEKTIKETTKEEKRVIKVPEDKGYKYTELEYKYTELGIRVAGIKKGIINVKLYYL